MFDSYAEFGLAVLFMVGWLVYGRSLGVSATRKQAILENVAEWSTYIDGSPKFRWLSELRDQNRGLVIELNRKNALIRDLQDSNTELHARLNDNGPG